MERRRPPGTEEGWYALHDFRRIDWDGWRGAPARERERAVGEGVQYLRAHETLEDAEEGASAVFSVVGHDADLLVLHLRPTLAHLDRAQRRFEATALAGFTERAESFVSVTEVSGYMHEELSEGIEDVDDRGTRSYMRQRIHPEIPDADHVCFYPMDKRRGETDNWYDLPFEERAAHMETHGEVGREYADRVRQIITGSIGLDDHEWGVTLFADDPTDFKQLLYEMRFDPSSSRYAEFGSFHVGRRFPPADLGALLAGEAVPTSESGPAEAPDAAASAAAATPETAEEDPTADDTSAAGTDDGVATGSGGAAEREHGAATAPGAGAGDSPPGAEATGSGAATEREGAAGRSEAAAGESGDGDGRDGDGRPDAEPAHEEVDAERFARLASTYGVDAAADAAGYGLLFESEADAGTVAEEVEGLRANFDHYDTHVETVVRSDDSTTVVGSLWANERAADTASGFLADLPGVTRGVGADVTDHEAGPETDVGPAVRPGASQPVESPQEGIEPREFRRLVHRFGVDPDDHPAADYALLFRSERVAEDLVEDVDEVRGRFEDSDTHVLTTVRADSGDTAVISLWATEEAADTAAGHLADLPGSGPGVGADFGADDDQDEATVDSATDDGPNEATVDSATAASGGSPSVGGDEGDVRAELAELGVYAGQPHGEDVHALVLYSEADPDVLEGEVSTLTDRFERYDDDHDTSAVYVDAAEGDRSAVVSIWEDPESADEAADNLSALPGVVGRAGEAESGFGTMGMFYSVKPAHREAFVETFEEVGEALAEMEGHLDTRLMVNVADENDMFIASQWRAKADAMDFFRSDEFRDTVEWGREILDDRPRHVFLA
jgi:chlorite dismutase